MLGFFSVLASAQSAPARPSTSQPVASHQSNNQTFIGSASYIRPVPQNYRFPNGQVLHYTAEWRLFDAGVATLRMDANGPNEQKVTATADSTGVVSLLFKVADRFESAFDKRTFCSLRIKKHTEEGLRKRDTNIRFDAARKKAVLDETNLRNGATKHAEEDIPACVSDVLSGIYYVASLPLKPGDEYLFPINDGGKTVDVKVTVERTEEIKTDAGTFQTVRVQPSSDSGVLKSKGKVWIWYTNDAAHTPVQMRARLFWGSLTIRLTSIEKSE